MSTTTTNLGKVCISAGGTFNSGTTYSALTVVQYNGSAYLTLQSVSGVIPTNDGINYMLLVRGYLNPNAAGTLANRPTAGTSIGQMYFATDQTPAAVSAWSGTAWISL